MLEPAPPTRQSKRSAGASSQTETSEQGPIKEHAFMFEPIENLAELCERSTKIYRDRRLFGTKAGGSWRWMTYGEFKRDVDRFRAALADLGVGPGDRVAIVADNRVEWAVACYASYGLRAAFVPMYEQQHPDEWQFILNDCSAKAVIGARPKIYDQLVAMKAKLPALEHVIGLESGGDHAYAALLGRGEAKPVPTLQPEPSETAGLIYTSGTTGKPKGVILSHGNICSNINAVHEIFEHEMEDLSLAFLPWAHSFGQTCELHSLVSSGCALAINDDVANLVANLAEVKPTVLFAVPRIFNRIYEGVNKQMAEKPAPIRALFHSAIRTRTRLAQGEPVSTLDRVGLVLADRLIFSKVRERFGGRLRYVVSGSAALSKEVAEFIDALGIEVYEGYGLTETSPIATGNYPGNRKIGSVGKAIPGVTIKIDKSVTDDPKNGEIVIYGPNIMQGYYNRPEENDQVLMSDGGFRSGDMGHMDDDGYVYITGRIKEQYKLENGKYVVPSPLEEQLKLSPYIANVMIHGANRPHNVALVVPDFDSLKKWASENGVALGDVAKNEKVKALLRSELDKYGADFKGFERPKDFVVSAEDFTTTNGMLTPTLKLKRRNVLAKYEGALESLY
ncbi:MAG TPA: long-chain fatty acid--CoA ligase [Polyangiaceae bacterium]|nr:long-chain fatty acid--CoA ligase [Polyangiaceae bacterium]